MGESDKWEAWEWGIGVGNGIKEGGSDGDKRVMRNGDE